MNEIKPIENNETWGSIRAKLNELISSSGGSPNVISAEEVSHPIQHFLILDSNGELKKMRTFDIYIEYFAAILLFNIPNHLPANYYNSADGWGKDNYEDIDFVSILTQRGYINLPVLENVSVSLDMSVEDKPTLSLSAHITNPDNWDPKEVRLELGGKYLDVIDAVVVEGKLSVTGRVVSYNYIPGQSYDVALAWYRDNFRIWNGNLSFPSLELGVPSAKVDEGSFTLRLATHIAYLLGSYNRIMSFKFEVEDSVGNSNTIEASSIDEKSMDACFSLLDSGEYSVRALAYYNDVVIAESDPLDLNIHTENSVRTPTYDGSVLKSAYDTGFFGVPDAVGFYVDEVEKIGTDIGDGTGSFTAAAALSGGEKVVAFVRIGKVEYISK